MRCGVCGQKELKEFLRAAEVPVFCNVLWPSRDQALTAPRGEVRLGSCGECGYIYNLAFKPSVIKYSDKYGNPLHFSKIFREYIDKLTERLVERYELHGKDIIEIGCGDGYFLGKLCQAGGNRGIGFDPGCEPAQGAGAAKGQVTILAEEYGQAHAHYPVDLICCRQVLEHIHRPVEFLSEIRETIGDRSGTKVFFEVPNALYSLKRLGIWDIIYEHCCYFVPTALERLFRAAGFEPTEIRPAYGRQFLWLEAVPSAKQNLGKCVCSWAEDNRAELIEGFASIYRSKADSWRKKLEDICREGLRAVVWGAGSKGVSFLNTLGIQNDAVEYVVDMNPNKCGRFVAGTAQQVVGPGFLQEYRPDTIIIMNGIYRKEIEGLLREMSLNCQVLVA